MRATNWKLILIAGLALSGAGVNAETSSPAVHFVPEAEGGSMRSVGPLVASSAVTAPQGVNLQFASLSPAPAAQAATVAVNAPAQGRSTQDLLALVTIGGMLVAYQLFRKHRLLRQQPFSL